jgi:hypothetical protein
MQVGRLARPLALPVLAMLMVFSVDADGRAQGHDNHVGGVTAQQRKPTREQNALVQAVRDATSASRTCRRSRAPAKATSSCSDV